MSIEGAQEGGGSNGAGPVRGISRGVVVVCPLRDELVLGVLPDCDETFGGGQGHGQERLSPEPAQSVKVGVRKVLQDHDLAPFSSDKIRAKILDLGYGGALSS